MVQFKLQHRGLVRKVTFKNVDQPSWHELSWKIGDVCNIPHAAVALTYLDPDGDKITISSQAELKEYYSSLDEEELESNVPHKFIVRNLNEGVPDDGASDPREDNFLMRDAQTMAASTVGGGSQWGFNPEDEAERDPTKLRLSGYSTFADALGPLAGSTVGTEDDTETENDELPGGFKSAPSAQPAQPAKSSGWGLPMFGVWGSSKNTGDAQPSTSPPADPAPKQQPATNPWDNDQNVTKTPAWAAATTPTSTKAPPTPWAPPSSVATGALKGGLGRGGAPPPATSAPTNLASSTSSAAHPSGIVPAPVAPIVQMDSMVADRASAYAASPAFTATLPKSKKKKKMTQAERAKEEAAAKRAAEAAKIEEMELKAMEREAQREREENARISAEAAARAAVDEQRRVEEREWERERLRLKDEEERRKRQPEQPTYHPTHQHRSSDMSYSDEWQHVNNQSPDQEDEEAYRARIEAARANVFGTSPSAAQPPPSARPRKSSTKSKGERSTGKSSRPTSKVYPPTPAPQKHTDSGLGTDDGHSPWNIPTVSGFPPAGPANPTTAQVCSDVADLLVSFGRILDNERDLLDAIRETFSHNLGPGALNATFGNRNLSPEMLRIVASVDDLLTKILPSRPPASHASANMELEPRIPTPSVTPTPVIPAEPEFNVPKTEYGNSFEFANRGRQSVPVINVPRPKYPVSPLTRDGYSTGTTPPAQPPHGYAASPFLSASPDKSSRARSRSRPPPGDFEIVPPSHLPPQARVVPPPVVPDDETDGSPMTPDASRGFARQSTHEGGLVLANQTQRSTDVAKADMEAARQHYKSQRELYKLEKAERKKEMEERAAAKAERKRAKAAMNTDPNIADLTNQLQNLVPPRPYEAERRYIESPYDNAPRAAGPYPGSTPGNTVYAEGLGQVTLVPPPGSYSAHAAVTAPVSPVHEESPAPSFERARRRRQSLNGGSPERYSHSRPPPSTSSRTETYHGLQPDAFPGAAHHSQYAQGQAPQQDLAKRVALRLTEMGYTPQKYPALPAILGHRIRPLTNTPGVSENELAYHIIQDLFKYGGHN